MSRRLLSLLMNITSAAEPAAAEGSFGRLLAAGDRARDTKDWETAVVQYRAALKMQPEAHGIRVQLGHALKESGRYAEAEECYHSFLAVNPADSDIHLQLGHLFLRQDRGEDAREWYEKAAALAAPDSAIAADAGHGLESCDKAPLLAIQRRALALTDRARFEDAYEPLSTLVIEHGCEDLTGILGNVCKELGRFGEAEGYYNRYETFAREKRPNLMFDVAIQRGHFAKARRDYAGAVGHFVRAKALVESTTDSSCSIRELDDEIRVCVAQITKAIELH